MDNFTRHAKESNEHQVEVVKRRVFRITLVEEEVAMEEEVADGLVEDKGTIYGFVVPFV